MKKYKSLLSLIGIFILVYLFYSIDISKFFSIIKKTNLILLIISLIPTICIVFFRGLRWWLITQSFDMDFSYRNAVVGYLLGTSLGSITPARLGNFIRIKFLKQKTKQPIQNSILNMIVDNVVDILTLFFISAVSILLLFYIFNTIVMHFVYIVIFIIFIVIFYISVSQRKRLYSITKPLIFFFVPSKYKNTFKVNLKIYHNWAGIQG